MNNLTETNHHHRKWILPKAVWLSLLCFLVASQSFAQSWTQFRGNKRNGISTETGLLEKWPETGPKKLWSKDIGSGFPEVVVENGTAYLLAGDTLSKKEYVQAFDAVTGKELWKTDIDSLYFEKDGWGHGPRATPVIDTDKLYCFTGFGKFCALSRKDGKALWSVNIPVDYNGAMPRWGYTSSPILIDGVLILETGGKEGKAFTGFDKNTGKEIWSKGIGKSSYNSPAIAKIDGQTHVVFAIDTLLYGISPQGEELWQYRVPLHEPTPMPVVIPPNKIFLCQVGQTGGVYIEIENNQAKEVMKSRTMQNNWSSSIYHDGYLYGFTRARVQCVDAETGELKWSQRGHGKGSLIMVDEKLLVLSDKGKLIMVEASPKAYKEIASFQALTGKSWTAPSFADGKLYVRNLTQLACYQLTK